MSQQSQFLLLPNSGAGYKKSTESQTVYNSKLKEDREEAVGYFILQIHRRTQDMEVTKSSRRDDTKITDSDLSEQIKAVTKDSHVRAENTQLMLNYQKGEITLSQYKLLLCSLYEVYRALEDELDRSASHPSVVPIYFPQELARVETLEEDLEHFLGPHWRKRITVPAATQRYVQRLREIGKQNPRLLVAHAYTRYLGDLSGGQVLGRITQKSLGLSSKEGLSFFSFPGVPSPNRFKQLYRSRMNSIDLTKEERKELLDEAVAAFEANIEMFDDLQKILSLTEDTDVLKKDETTATNQKTILYQYHPIFQFTVGVCVALATVGMGIYAF
ncbi:heme oxygenase 1a [Clupea harengus]|uniref:heme oxygenase (biliverdin-producing) n=1 Tax=Clupea harengus TaxID=7950 RepID=A0A6P3VTU0_CLUHA|nr:heme oxygenase 1a [Clupea harengus]